MNTAVDVGVIMYFGLHLLQAHSGVFMVENNMITEICFKIRCRDGWGLDKQEWPRIMGCWGWVTNDGKKGRRLSHVPTSGTTSRLGQQSQVKDPKYFRRNSTLNSF